MILKWIKSIIGPPITGSGEVLPPHKTGRSKEELLDIAHEALKNEASELSDIVKMGEPTAKRKKLKEKIRRKVKNNIASEYDDPEVVEEVTEKILNVAEFDPHYRELFDDENA